MELKNVEIKSIGEIKTFGESGFKVLKFIVLDDSNQDYPQTLELQCTQDKADNLIKYNKVGDRVDISFNLRGREWTNPETQKKSVFNTIEAWKVFKCDVKEIPQFEGTSDALKDLNVSPSDDLPF